MALANKARPRKPARRTGSRRPGVITSYPLRVPPFFASTQVNGVGLGVTRQAQGAIQARLNKPPKNLKSLATPPKNKSLATTATCLALVQAAPKGVPNKVNRDLKEAYLMAANLPAARKG